MPLHGYLKTSSPGRISTITNYNGDKTRSKKLYTLDSSLSSRIYIADCVTHDPVGGVVPVIIVEFQPGTGWTELGTAKCCPLCWMILVPPVDDFPDPVLQLSPDPAPRKGAKPRRKTVHVQEDGSSITSRQLNHQKLMDLIDNHPGEFSIYDVIEAVGCSKATALNLIKPMIARKKIIVTSRSTGGRGQMTLYKKAP
jgi:hypothetical protein